DNEWSWCGEKPVVLRLKSDFAGVMGQLCFAVTIFFLPCRKVCVSLHREMCGFENHLILSTKIIFNNEHPYSTA
ncbi:MAG: hypothetical protein K5918_05120, partial [Bacteroidales bacterium]|nr:hypothetical protein [Bacteroidales bacterium]